MLLTWHGHGDYRARVEAVEPPNTFAFGGLRRAGNEPGDGTTTLVEITLAPEGPRTRELNELRDYAARLGSSPEAHDR
jgi:hypothetical protein